jgi:hypothetical protein
VGLINKATGKLVYVSDTPSNIAQFVGSYLESQGIIDKLDKGTAEELERLVMKKFGNMPESIFEAGEKALSIGSSIVIGVGFGLEKWLVSNIPVVGPIVAAMQDILRIPQIAEAIVKRMIAVLFDIGEDVADKIFPAMEEKKIEKWLSRMNRGDGAIGNIKERIEAILEGLPIVGPVIDKLDDVIDRDDKKAADNEPKKMTDEDADRIASRMGGDNKGRRRLF